MTGMAKGDLVIGKGWPHVMRLARPAKGGWNCSCRWVIGHLHFDDDELQAAPDGAVYGDRVTGVQIGPVAQ